ncbi:ATP-binding cassette domain-containing protein [Noviherbaspirillum pedocola]|uniref:ABC transporter ATP-binding protein n=1 Tax=Noviherbaspirillum pedocola TaxID=2801341 RepID=A0A934SUK0_9BURK|nr:ATP-binding cassette domain-containing protein [Noviherbaspirillum pedocola]MBK4737071.1 ABC transporter ATP-binding protein [Noviherbaspirillum pedocola]
MTPRDTAPLMALNDIVKRFDHAPDLAQRALRLFGAPAPKAAPPALAGVSLDIAAGETLGLVGESGSGKSTLARIAAGLLPPSSGTRLWQGQDTATMDAAERRRLRLAVQMVFQNPYASLNPRMRVIDIIGEAPVAHGVIARARQRDAVAGLMRQVGLDPALMSRFPHQFSGGQRARIGIARALAVRPELLILDEAVAALDVSIQAQVLNLFMALRAELSLTCLFVSHDLSVVRHVADRVAVIHLGRLVEVGPADAVFSTPAHDYTRALLAAAPKMEARGLTYVPNVAASRREDGDAALVEIGPGHYAAR